MNEPSQGGVDPKFWGGRRVLLTGHTGFKGAWAALWLSRMGAAVTGLALPPPTSPSLYELAGVDAHLDSHIADIRDAAAVRGAVEAAAPDIVLHMAAESIVRRSRAQPIETFATNVMGTVHLLDALRRQRSIEAVLVVTTDKVYRNDERGLPFVETDRLGGHEPYSASKAAAEIATEAMAKSYFDDRGVPVATARGGNVIGGGDFSLDRLVPDIIRAIESSERLVLRNPRATRPWQHVLDCVGGYLCFLQSLAQRRTEERALNFGPTAAGVEVETLVRAVMEAMGVKPDWDVKPSLDGRESALLSLDARHARVTLDWDDRYPGDHAVNATAAWYLAWRRGADLQATSLAAIDDYMALSLAPPARHEARRAACDV